MKNYLLIVFGIIGVVSLSGCQKNEVHTSVLGNWYCDEYPEQTLPRTYQVNIIRSPINDTIFYISNFYKMGYTEDVQVYFYIDRSGELILLNQIIGNRSISGKGKVINNYESLEWEYYISDGSVNETVKATYY